MKIKMHITILLIVFVLASCAQVTQSDPTEVPTGTPTITPVPPTSTTTPIPSATMVPFNLSGNIAMAEQDFIYIYSVGGVKVRPIQAAGVVSDFEFSAQGRIAAYSTFNMINNDLFYFAYGLKTYRLDTNKRNNLVDDNTRVIGFFWDETGERLIYLTFNGVYSASTSEDMKEEVLFWFPGGIFANRSESAFEVHPSPDGQSFVVTQSIRKQVGENRFQDAGFNVYYFSPERNIAIKLNDEPHQSSAANRFEKWSPDGDYFFYRAVDHEEKVKFYVFNASSALPVDGSPYFYPLLWSPDSSLVSQINWEYQGRVLMNSGDLLRGWNEMYSYSERSYLTNMAWSPDSNLLAINDGSWLKVYNTQETQVETLTDSLDIIPRQMIWSSDGDNLVITDSDGLSFTTSKCNFRIYSFSKNQWISVPAVACTGVDSFHWSSDGKSLLFATYSEYSSREINTASVYVLDVESATTRKFNVESIEFELIP